MAKGGRGVAGPTRFACVRPPPVRRNKGSRPRGFRRAATFLPYRSAKIQFEGQQSLNRQAM